MKAAGSVSPCNPPLVSLCCHRLSEAAESAGLTWLSFGTDGWTVGLVNMPNITQRATLVACACVFLSDVQLHLLHRQELPKSSN